MNRASEPIDVPAHVGSVLRDAVSAGATASAVYAAAIAGEAQEPVAVGAALRFGDQGTELPAGDQVPATPETFYDLASITKLFTAITALSLVADGSLALDEPVGEHLAQYRDADKAGVNLRHLLTHTSGLPAEWSGWRSRFGSGRGFHRGELLADLLDTGLLAAPGSRFEYSCIGYNTVMALCEARSGMPWAALVQDRVLDHLPTTGITGRPEPGHCAATEFRPDLGRGMIRGSAHDEAAWSLGGLSGNAGMFATAPALLVFAEALRTGLEGILPAGLAAEMWQAQVSEALLPGEDRQQPDFGQGLGLRIGQRSWMGARASSGAVADRPRGHGGFTGTSLLIDKTQGISIALLANQVHPSRTGPGIQPTCREIVETVYRTVLPG
ncbi:MAG: beta-lactamase family protein [Renibacterium salmoninarum]|nr:beta-lactamase family protein [Renibacterium salmoninarum]